MLMVKAGKPVDDLIEQLLPYLEAGDIIIDGGNSNYNDSIRRTAYVESKGLLFIGTDVSGGEEGARHGPSIMPDGSPAAWPHVKPIFQAVAAEVKRPDGGALVHRESIQGSFARTQAVPDAEELTGLAPAAPHLLADLRTLPP